MLLYPVGNKDTRIGGCKFSFGGAQMAQPSETMQSLQPTAMLDRDLKWRCTARIDHMAGEMKPPVVDFLRECRIGKAKVWRDQLQQFGRASAETPAIERASAQPAPRSAPKLTGNQRSSVLFSARTFGQDESPVPPLDESRAMSQVLQDNPYQPIFFSRAAKKPSMPDMAGLPRSRSAGVVRSQP